MIKTFKRLPFRDFHTIKILDGYDIQNKSLSLFVNNYLRENKALGSKDRLEILKNVYDIIRYKLLLDYLSKDSNSWEKKLEIYKSLNFKKAFDDPKIPTHIRLNFPKELFDLLVSSYSEEKAIEICTISNKRAPLTIRSNPLKTTRNNLYEILINKDINVELCKKSNLGLTIKDPINLFTLDEYKNGFFEVQDEASQLVTLNCPPKPKQKVLDFCAGSCGKTLCFAPNMKNSGVIYINDIREQVIKEGKKRLKRASVTNYQIFPSIKKRSKFLNKMDYILLDVPCSGTGTIRRNIDMKYRFSKDMLEILLKKQKDIFDEAFKYLKPGGIIIYATCSILSEENETQVKHFLDNYPIEKIQNNFKTLPEENALDGFFAAYFKKHDFLK
jgi:16S rRNA (cytosine967-C5)-methyltransferase